MTAPSAGGSVRRVLVTGGCGLVGRQVVAGLAAEPSVEVAVALDLHEPEAGELPAGVRHERADVRDPDLAKRLEHHRIDTVVHLAAVVSPGPSSTREREYSIDVLGTRNVGEACVQAGVRQLVYTSSGAAYGYHPDNPVPLREGDPLRGNRAFAYAWHKRLAEEALADLAAAHPELAVLVLRVGTILGARVHSPVSAIFQRSLVVGVAGSEAPFVLVWDEDVADCIVQGIRERRSGTFNLCGDGSLPLREIARRLGKPYLPVPAPLLAVVLSLLQKLGLSTRGPEQVDFLRYRPVLSNEALVRDFGFRPRFSSEACFERYRTLGPVS